MKKIFSIVLTLVVLLTVFAMPVGASVEYSFTERIAAFYPDEGENIVPLRKPACGCGSRAEIAYDEQSSHYHYYSTGSTAMCDTTYLPVWMCKNCGNTGPNGNPYTVVQLRSECGD